MNQSPNRIQFQVTGASITQTLRDMVLDGRWREAMRAFDEMFGDGTISHDLKTAVLSGKMHFTGSTADDGAVDLEDDNTEQAAKYKTQLDDMFGGCALIGKRIYQATKAIIRYDGDDQVLTFRDNTNPDRISPADHDRIGLFDLDVLKQRAAKYATSKDAVVEFCRYDISDAPSGSRRYATIFEPAPDLPSWIIPSRSAQDAVVQRGSAVILSGAPNRSHQSEADLLTPTKIAELTARILDQNQLLGFGLREVNFGEEIGTVFIPEAPLQAWALKRLYHRDDDMTSIPTWTPINHSGVKMQNDDPTHTDWVMAAGLLDEALFDLDKRMDQLCYDVQNEHLGIKTHILVAAKPFAAGYIKFCKKDTEVDHETIAVIPHAGIEFTEIARTAAAVITINGGAMAHLVVNGLAEGLLIVREPDAKAKFEDGQHVWIDGETGTLEIRSPAPKLR